MLASTGVLSASVAASSLAQLSAAAPQASAGTVVAPDWEQVPLPLDPGVVLLDIGFTGTDPDHGFLLGLETESGQKMDPPGGDVVDLHPRVWVGRGGSAAPGYLRFHANQAGLAGGDPALLAAPPEPGLPVQRPQRGPGLAGAAAR